MRVFRIFALLSASVLCFCSCSDKKSSQASSTAEIPAATLGIGGIAPKEERFGGKNGFDVDLSEMSSTMVYAQVYDMVSAPDSYDGKSVRAKGEFSYFKDDVTGNEYFAVLIKDATACCAQGIEFVLDGKKYPDDYPKEGTEILVSGTFDHYDEDGYTYCRLLGASLEECGLSW